MSRYLEEAAQLLRDARSAYAKKNLGYPTILAEKQLVISDAFARLAAIDKGLLPLDMLPEILKCAEVSR